MAVLPVNQVLLEWRLTLYQDRAARVSRTGANGGTLPCTRPALQVSAGCIQGV
jgi:hypothetical protein